MIKRGKIIALLLGIFAALILSSCATETQEYYISDDYAVADDEYDANYENPDTDIMQAVFTGVPIRRDELLWQEGRHGEWEQDIRYFAVMVLRNHPLLQSFDSLGRMAIIEREVVDYPRVVHDVLLQRVANRNMILSDDADYIIYELRARFTYQVNSLILNIPYLSDYELMFGLSSIAAILGDAHTYVSPAAEYTFPVRVRGLYGGFYITTVPRDLEHILYGKLVAINGVEFDEIISRARKTFPYENEYGLRYQLMPSIFAINIVLYYIGVTDSLHVADFRIIDVHGETVDIQIETMKRDDFTNMSDEELARYQPMLKDSRVEEHFWHEHFPDENLMYIRITRFTPSQELNMARNELREKMRDWQYGDTTRFILDLRGNPGGHRDAEWPQAGDIRMLNEIAETVYLLIDGRSTSMSVNMASAMINNIDNLIVIGTPSGQPPNFFSGPVGNLANTELRYQIAHGMTINSTSEDVAIRPDIIIEATIEDIISGHDAVLAFIRGR